MKAQGIIILVLGALLLITVFGLIGMEGDEREYESDEDFIAQVRAGSREGRGSTSTTASRPPSVAGKDDLVAKIDLEAQVHDMGIIARDALSHGQLKVYNRGKISLRIRKIDTQCNCTTGSLPDKIPPGGEANLEITVNPYLIPGFYSRKILSIHSNDAVRSVARVEVRAQVDPEVSVDPRVLDFGAVEFGDLPERSVRIRQLTEEDFVISRVEAKDAEEMPFVVTHQEIPEENWAYPGKREYDVRVAVSPSAGRGDHTIGLVVHTDSYRRLKAFCIRVEMALQ